MSAAAVARSRGASPHTLAWWQWHLAATAPATASPRLVAVEVAPGAAPAAPAWELTLAGGHVVRVYSDAARSSLRVVLKALGAVSRAR